MGRQAVGCEWVQSSQQRQGCPPGTTAVCARLGLPIADGRRVTRPGQWCGPDALLWTRPALSSGVTAARHPQAPGTEGCGGHPRRAWLGVCLEAVKGFQSWWPVVSGFP